MSICDDQQASVFHPMEDERYEASFCLEELKEEIFSEIDQNSREKDMEISKSSQVDEKMS